MSRDQSSQPADEVPAEGHGADSEGRVRAVAVRARVKSLVIEPRAMRLTADELGECARSAVNAALADLRAKAPADVDPGIDAAGLSQVLNEVQTQGLRTMELLTDALEQAIGEIRRDAVVHGAVPPHGLQGLLEETQQAVAAVSPATGDVGDLEGAGEAARGWVRATAQPGGQVGALFLDRRAQRFGSQELAGHVTTAVNAALDDLQARSLQESGFTGVDAEALARLRESSTRQAAEFMTSLSDMINSIRPR